MITQPERGAREENDFFYKSEARRIALLNNALGDVKLSKEEERTLIWLAGWDDSTMNNVVSVIRKVTAKKPKQPSQL